MDDITLKRYFEIFTAAWKLFREFRDLKTDQDRDRLRNAAEMLYQKYPCQLMMDLNWAVFNEFDRRTGVKQEFRIKGTSHGADGFFEGSRA